MIKVMHEESESNANVPAGVGGSLLDELPATAPTFGYIFWRHITRSFCRES